MRKRRQSKARNARKVILVICEGETEATYVELLRRHYRLPITIKSRIVGNRISRRLVAQLLEEERLSGNEDSIIVYIYDGDIKLVVDKLRQLKGEIILSHPCIELWYLLHKQNHSREISSKDVSKLLENTLPLWNGYTKGVLTEKQKDFLLANQEEASNRAKLLEIDTNPSTNMYRFLEILEKEKKG